MLVNQKDMECVIKILELRTKTLDMYNKCLISGIYKPREDLVSLDHELFLLMKYMTKYDFVNRINSGVSLLIGEGNLSFTISLIKKLQNLSNLISSTYEVYNELSDIGKVNSKLLSQAGVKVMHSLDAGLLDKVFKQKIFDTIIFQFPHSGSREAIQGLNPNYVLVRDFIVSASCVLKRNGVILITIVDTDFYNNMFRFDELSQLLSISKPIKYKFDPSDYPSYTHTMTHEEESGIENYDKFATWEFKL